MKKYYFPVITKIVINNFSLFKKTQVISLDINKNVFCLAGANGLGKSTFINIVNYALTGIVKKADADFAWYKSIPGFYSKSKNFASDYFDGRVWESDRDLAEVTLYFTINSEAYKVTRGFFEPDELRCFEKMVDDKWDNVIENQSPSEINDEYEARLTKSMGLSEFDQFVFLQIFVFTFDESHQLLFWDTNLMERVLHLFFGVDSSKAILADQLRKDVSKYDSNVRNLQWNITKARNELENIVNQLANNGKNDTSSDDLRIYDEHKLLTEEIEELSVKLESISDDQCDVETIIADMSLKIFTLRAEYERIFNSMNPDDTPIEKNTEVIDVLNELKLKIFAEEDCESEIKQLISIIEELKQKYAIGDNEELLEELKKIDESLFNLKNEAQSALDRKNRLVEEEKTLSINIVQAKDKIAKIESDNAELIKKLIRPKENDGLSALVDSYKEQIERLVKQKDESRKKREQKKNELDPLERNLSLQYNKAESKFVPIFNGYAKSFLGLNIDIQLLISSKSASFRLDLNDSQRSNSHQLSESQRYFIDIALRMALIELCTHECTLLIDTPEGSLDIAYESRAGKMFADFSKENFKLILTANINTSQLLLQLAKICMNEKMHIERMTDWTILSDVQQQEEAFIEDAYSQLEEALKN